MRLNKRYFPVLLVITIYVSSPLFSQSYRNNSELSLENIMKGFEWTGTPPEDPGWDIFGEKIIFKWNPDNEILPSDYSYSLKDEKIEKVSAEEKKNMVPRYGISYNKEKTAALFTRKGKLFYLDIKEKDEKMLLNLGQDISNAFFSNDEITIYFDLDNNLFAYSLIDNQVRKLTDIVKEGKKERTEKKWSNDQEEWLYHDQMELFDVLKNREEKSEVRKKESEEITDDSQRQLAIGDSRIFSFGISSDENYISLVCFSRSSNGKPAIMPEYVTQSGFTKTRNVRSKVGYSFGDMTLYIIDTKRDTFYTANVSELPGIRQYFTYNEEEHLEEGENPREVYLSPPIWSPEGDRMVINIRSKDNKDRWIALVEPSTGKLTSLDWQHDDAWIGGPGIGWSTSSGTLGWIDNNVIFFQSEESGYSHLYTYNLKKSKKKALTTGKFEIYDPFLSGDKSNFYFTSNEKDPGLHHFYRIPVEGGKREILTKRDGNNEVILSPDEKTMLIRYSESNQPWELYLSKYNSSTGDWSDYSKITSSTSPGFTSYSWRIPEFINVPSSDGEMIPARLYKPDSSRKNGAAVIFVHGAGYLQNAHKWWSNYYREYMFHNFLVDNGYTVLDMDYRASAGYGRDWRTAIYRHMGGKDLDDNVDGAKFLVKEEGIDAERIGIYGGSYGGFITLMAQFTAPGVFKAGAALRPVTDWAHYNHGYTANILNTPVEDSVAYHRSSPIYFADNLEDNLLMCHGMVDDNVHFQDVVRLSQRLIELRKDNWELAVFPMEAHGFKEWTSWLDEYKRIYKLFEENLFDPGK